MPAAVIFWSPEGKYRRMKLADELRKDNFHKFWAATKYRREGELPPDSATGQVLSDDCLDEAEAVTTASMVFANVTVGDARRDVILREECLKLGNYGYLTLLSPHPSGKSN